MEDLPKQGEVGVKPSANPFEQAHKSLANFRPIGWFNLDEQFKRRRVFSELLGVNVDFGEPETKSDAETIDSAFEYAPIHSDAYPKCGIAFTIEDQKKTAREFAAEPPVGLFLRLKSNVWHFEKDCPSFEHPAVAKLLMYIKSTPHTGESRAVVEIDLQPDFGITSGSPLSTVLAQAEHVNNEIFRYEPEVFKEKTTYSTRSGRGHGVLFDLNDDSLLSIELEDGHLTMAHVDSCEGTRTEFAETIEKQLELVSKEFPAFIEHVVQIWGTGLYITKLNPKAGQNSHSPEPSIKDPGDGEQPAAYSPEAPDHITDPRERELFTSMVRPTPSISFDMIGGLDTEVKEVRRAISRGIHAEQYREAGLDPRATLLLIGPPGSGKTMVAEAVAHEVNGSFLAVKGSNINSLYVGESEKNVAAMFQLVDALSKQGPVVLFLDEMDALVPDRSRAFSFVHDEKVVAEFLAALNKKYENTIIIGASNAPQNIDPAVIRPGRFSDVIIIGNPDERGRSQIIGKWIATYSKIATKEVFQDIDIEHLAAMTEGLNGADLSMILEAAIARAVEESLDTGLDFRPVSTDAIAELVQIHIDKMTERSSSYLPERSSAAEAQAQTGYI